MDPSKAFETVLASAKNIDCQAIKSIDYLLYMPTAVLRDFEIKGYDYTSACITPKNNIKIDQRFDDQASKVMSLSDISNFEVKATLGGGLEISNCNNFKLVLTDLIRDPSKANLKFFIKIQNCKNFSIFGGKHTGYRNFILISGSQDFVLRDLDVSGCDGYGIIIFDSIYFRITKSVFRNCLASGVYCLGKTMYGQIEKSRFLDGRGYFNWDAGLHINHCTELVQIDDVPERSHENANIFTKGKKPCFIYVRYCDFLNNRAQGIYCEGVNNVYISHCIIRGNNKEGICFDWGSALNGFVGNNVFGNGRRAALSREEIKADFIEQYPILEDGSSSCKLAGVSIDNGALNNITNNVFYENYGGGIKMVRTGLSNLIMNNDLIENGIGANEHFRHYNAISMMAMGVGQNEFSNNNKNLDFMPSSHNFIAGNKIIGSTHYYGVFSAKGCSDNTVHDNSIHDVSGAMFTKNIQSIVN